MISILATVDGSPESMAIIPTIAKLAGDLQARIQLLTVVQHPKGTPRRKSVPRAIVEGGYAMPGGLTSPEVHQPYQQPWAETEEQALERVLDEGREFLESASRPLVARGFEVQSAVVVDANVSRAIAKFAKESGADLIAMATHGRGGLSDIVQGSVASEVVRSGVAPVLLVRPTKAQIRAHRASSKSTLSTGARQA